MNVTDMFKFKKYWDAFVANHPKFPMFLQAARNGMIEENSVIGVQITNPEGRTIETNIKLTQSDLDMFRALMEMKD